MADCRKQINYEEKRKPLHTYTCVIYSHRTKSQKNNNDTFYQYSGIDEMSVEALQYPHKLRQLCTLQLRYK